MSTESLPPSGDSNDKLLTILCHISIFFAGLVFPLVIYLIKKDSPLVQEHAKEALNFHITVVIAVVVSIVLCFAFIGMLVLPLVVLGAYILGVIAAMKASDGQFYKYPLTLRLVK